LLAKGRTVAIAAIAPGFIQKTDIGTALRPFLATVTLKALFGLIGKLAFFAGILLATAATAAVDQADIGASLRLLDAAVALFAFLGQFGRFAHLGRILRANAATFLVDEPEIGTFLGHFDAFKTLFAAGSLFELDAFFARLSSSIKPKSPQVSGLGTQAKHCLSSLVNAASWQTMPFFCWQPRQSALSINPTSEHS
jgi:hypothetical protein